MGNMRNYKTVRNTMEIVGGAKKIVGKREGDVKI